MKKTKKYMSIYEQVKQDIIAGRYETGSKLPSKRVMAEAMGVSVITIEHAYELLDEEGYILSKEKSGYFVTFDDSDIYSGKTNLQQSDTGRQGRAQIHISAVSERDIRRTFDTDMQESQPSDEPRLSLDLYSKTVRRVLSEYGENIMRKSPMQGVYELRRAISGYLDRGRRIRVSTENIVIGAGAEYLYGLIVQTLGREIVYGIESPSYQKIAKVYEAGGATLEMLSLGDDGIESSQLWNSNADVLHITPYRSFPSGVTASASKKREYVRWSLQKDALIIEDDFESEFTPSRKPEETIYSLDDDGRVIYVNTFTRTVGSYMRTAYMVIPDRLKDIFFEKVGFYECPVPALDQYILAQLLENGDFERHINRVRRYNRRK